MVVSLWSHDGIPAGASVETGDTAAYTLGTVIRPDVDGTITAIHFYRTGSEGSGFDAGRSAGVWDASGTPMASKAGGAESGSGWRTITLDAPLSVTAGTLYVVGVEAQTYLLQSGLFDTTVDVGDLAAPASALAGGNGRYHGGAGLAYPETSSGSSCYFVDVTFTPAALSAPEVVSPPAIAGTARVNEALEVVPGTLTGTPAPARTYQWLRNGSDIPDATDPWIVLGEDDLGATFGVRETGTNSEGSASATSSTTAAVIAAPAPMTLYVATTGSDTTGDGSSGNPYGSVYKASQMLTAGGGHTISVAAGTYPDQGALWIGGARGALNRLVGEPGTRIVTPPQVEGVGYYSAIRTYSSYWEIAGIEVVAGTGHGIDCQGAHHIWVHHCYAHDCDGGGISSYQSDWILFEDNVAHDNASTNWNQCSGFSHAEHYELSVAAWDKLHDGTTQWRSATRRNISFDNIEGAAITATHTDGNGVIIDWMLNEGTGRPPYPGPILVEANLCYGNGAKGIQVFRSDHVTVRNNTVWCNNVDAIMPAGDVRWELSNAHAASNIWVNNIGVCDTSTFANVAAIGDGVGRNLGVEWINNLTYDLNDPESDSLSIWDGNEAPTSGDGNLLGVDPMLSTGTRVIEIAGQMVTVKDLRLQPGSPAIGAGTDAYGLPATDLDGRPRITGGAVDLGAIGAPGDILIAAAGAYDLTGQSAALAQAQLLTAGAGALTLSGQNASLIFNSEGPMADLVITAANVIAGSNATASKVAAAGEVINAGQAIYMASATKKWMLADSDSATAEARKATHIALNSAGNGQPLVGQSAGDITIGATLTAGATYFLSNTPGGICPDADVGAGEYVCMVGIAKSTSVLTLYFNFPGVSR